MKLILKILRATSSFAPFRRVPVSQERIVRTAAISRKLVAWSGVVVTAFVFCGTPNAQEVWLRLNNSSTPLPTINLAGAEFAGKKLPGVMNRDYTYPQADEIDYFLDAGFAGVRLPFKWERLQRKPLGGFHKAEIAEIDRVVAQVTGRGGVLILDPHNYGRRDGIKISPGSREEDAFVDLWRRLARRYRDNGRVVFGLMNEPHGIAADDWAQSVQRTIKAIREEGADNLVLVPGTAWSGAHSWESAGNAAAFDGFHDPGDNFAYEVHQYLDKDYSGTDATCISADVGAAALAGKTAWLKEQGARAFLGEFGASANPPCPAALANMLTYMEANADVWMGWSYWAAGRWWGDYAFSIHPRPDGSTVPQLETLKPFLSRPR